MIINWLRAMLVARRHEFRDKGPLRPRRRIYWGRWIALTWKGRMHARVSQDFDDDKRRHERFYYKCKACDRDLRVAVKFPKNGTVKTLVYCLVCEKGELWEAWLAYKRGYGGGHYGGDRGDDDVPPAPVSPSSPSLRELVSSISQN